MSVTFNPETDTFHVLNLCGTIFYIDSTTRKEIEQFLRDARQSWEWRVIDDLSGTEVTVCANAVNAIWSTSPESRAAERQIIQALKEPEEL